MTTQEAKVAARDRIAELVENFRQNEVDYLGDAYNETQARTEFISPLLEALGWDVHNNGGQTLLLREVKEEATVEVGEDKVSRKPDYELRVARQRKIFIEAKKPSVPIEHHRLSAFQVRRYGYSASLPVSVLTNFHQLAVYDCQPFPTETDGAHVARVLLLKYDQFLERFDELWDTLSRDSVYSGKFDRKFAVGATRQGAQQFDDFFLNQVRTWRVRLAQDIHVNFPALSSEELTYAVQLFLCRIVFLRICEDRDIEKYETLLNLDGNATYDALMRELQRADEFFDSGLFRLLDDEQLAVRISDNILQSIIAELYYPQSPYTFSVVETEVLGRIYEQFLGDVIDIGEGIIKIVSKPEVRESGGVVPTPQYIVDAIVGRTLGPCLTGKAPSDLTEFTVADICCGSGTFLLSAYDMLLEHYLSWYVANDSAGQVGQPIYQSMEHQWQLTFEEKRRILLEHIRGVDISSSAVEVTQFSLLLKLIENETIDFLQDYVKRNGEPALPALEGVVRTGNSLVSYTEWADALGYMDAELVPTVNPFSWTEEFPNEMGREGFDVVLGNPPYVRIQNMSSYSPQEVAFYQNLASPYSTGHQDNFDKYELFLERALSLVRPTGRLGFIVPHKFMTIRSGQTIRGLVARERTLEEIVHFGAKQVFGTGISNYTSILIFDRRGCDSINLEVAGPLEEWRYGQLGSVTEIPADELDEQRWEFVDYETRALFSRIRENFQSRLKDLSEIFVGVQTSADDIYIFQAVAEEANTVTLRWNDRNWPIERGILRPCLHDVTLFPYARPTHNTWMIFPYEMVQGPRRERASVIQPADFAERFPGCWEYLCSRRVELEQRNIKGGLQAERQWYQFGRSQSLTKFNSPKIILPILSLGARYSYDDSNIVVTGGGNGPYYMIRPLPDAGVSNYYLLAVLHHPLIEALIRSNPNVFRGGYYSHGKQFIRDLPIPMPDGTALEEIEGAVEELFNAIGRLGAARIPRQRLVMKRRVNELTRQMEERVTDLFDLSAEDLEVIRAVAIPA